MITVNCKLLCKNSQHFDVVVVIFLIELFQKEYSEVLTKRLESTHSVSILVFSKMSLEEFEIHSKDIGAPRCRIRLIVKSLIYGGTNWNGSLTEEESRINN